MRAGADAFARVGRNHLIQRMYDYPRLVALARSAVNLVVPKTLVQVSVVQGPLSGIHLYLNLHREKAFWFGNYETWVQRLMCELLKSGDRAWDVGACFGYHTLLLCKLCEPENVLAIEPDPNNQIRLAKNLRCNGFEATTLVTSAVGAVPGQHFLRRHSIDPGQSVVERSGKVEVGVTTLDLLLDEYGPPALVKVDIEGAEDLMFKGAARLLQDVRPVWILEAHGEPGEEAVGLLRSHGYRVRGFGKGHEVAADFPVGGPRHVFAEP